MHAEGKLQVLEEFRLPADFDPTTVDVFNTNTFLVRAEPLAKQPLTWTYFEVEKKVDGRPAIQFERLLQEITAQMPSSYLEVSRDGAASRFLPVKDFDELAKRRARDIELVARARGMLLRLALRVTNPVHFEVVHEFDIPLDALELAVISPNLFQELSQRLHNIESVSQKEHVLTNDRSSSGSGATGRT